MEEYRFAAVVLDSALDRPLDYAIPADMKVRPGSRVRVPVRTSVRLGTILELKARPGVANVVSILEVEPPVISEELFALMQWISRYYCTPLRKVVRLALPPGVRRGMEEKRQLFARPLLTRPKMAELCREKQGSPQGAVLEVLLQKPKGVFLSELLEVASRSPIDALAKAGIVALEKIEIDRSTLHDAEFFQTKHKTLNPEQEVALKKITATIQEGRFETHLLHGVTGSGKTEVYLQAIQLALDLGKGAIFLVPEIALTSQTVERLKSRFAERIAILHHRLSDGERRDAWFKIQSGEIPLVVGPRSALFSPIPRLGLIIVDEEHETSYKQTDDTPCYHARDVSIVRAKLCQACVVLGSATPSLESYTNALSGKYTLSTLKLRADQASLPQVILVEKKSSLLSDTLLEAIKKRLAVGEQSLLFLNRRGFHTQQMCTACSSALECPHCALALTFHKSDNLLACHLCNYEIAPPRNCPSCHAEESLKYKGAGTEQVERALHAIFPEIRTLRLDADTTRHKGSHEKLFKQFRAGKADVLIGTQMVAKGLHFPSVTLVGVLNADGALHIPDFRAAENVFQLLTQVAGRSGRATIAGEVVIQTNMITHPVITKASQQDYLSFYNDELASRKMFGFPPFSHLVKCLFSGPNASQTQEAAQEVRKRLIAHLPSAFSIHPVVPCGYAKIKDLFRFQFLIRGESVYPISDLLTQIKISYSDISSLVDVDPISTYF
jgi:primosomal protein N' (replication factor Y)